MKLIPEIYSWRSISGLCVIDLSYLLQTSTSSAQAKPIINGGSRTVQVSARGQLAGHVTTRRPNDVNMMSSQVLKDGSETMVNGDYYP